MRSSRAHAPASAHRAHRASVTSNASMSKASIVIRRAATAPTASQSLALRSRTPAAIEIRAGFATQPPAVRSSGGGHDAGSPEHRPASSRWPGAQQRVVRGSRPGPQWSVARASREEANATTPATMRPATIQGATLATGPRRSEAFTFRSCYEARTVASSAPMPPTVMRSRSPATSGPTPSGVPVSTMSPGSSVMTSLTNESTRAMPKIMSRVLPA